MDVGKVAVVLGLGDAALDFFDIAAFEDPIAAQSGQAFLHGALETGIAPGSGAIIDANRVVGLKATVERPGGGQLDFAHGHTNIGMEGSGNVNPRGIGHLFTAVRFVRFFGCDHIN